MYANVYKISKCIKSRKGGERLRRRKNSRVCMHTS